MGWDVHRKTYTIGRTNLSYFNFYHFSRLVRAVFLFPSYLEKNGERMQRNLEDKYQDLINSDLQEPSGIDEQPSKIKDQSLPKETKKKK